MAKAVMLSCAFFLIPHASFGQLVINSPTTVWTPVTYTSPNQYDYPNDEQTGRPESDIVGTAGQPAFYFKYDSSSSTMGFRVRVGSDLPQAGTFDSALFIGIDGNADGALDLFVGADNAGGSSQIKIWAPGTGLNISPNTTTINNPANQKTYAETSANFDFSQVSLTINPGATNFDLNADGTTDRFVSFSLPFADIASEMNRLAGISITTNSALRYVVATSSQDNSLNEDLNGVPKTFDGSQTWQQLGAQSDPTATVPTVPEPGTWVLTGLGIAALGLRAMFRRRR